MAVRRIAVLTACTAAALACGATAASAHVTANPRSAEKGGFSKVSFRVPNERDDASTNKVVVRLPLDHPIAFVSVRPTPGWTVKVEKSKLDEPVEAHGSKLTEAVSTITWSGGRIDPGNFEEFDVSLGPLPEIDRMVFPAEQTYTGGEVVKWDQPPAADGSEPEHPAPVLTLTDAAPAARKVAAPSVAADSSDGTARLLGGAGLGAGVAGLAVGAFGLARGRRRA
ncbi:YcnI family protein [Actinomadura flavalba]|uniref:YcnI family copper-binding membrane protein n=1 Tax=Actinomadura flavalba TaxID=1120938 RepID=UPI0003794FA7|nr:YcnI family protein [Actinomadura flavalba]